MTSAAALGDVAFSAGANAHRFVILGRSKARSDAAQTSGAAPQPKGSMPGLPSVATVHILPRSALWPASRHGSLGLRSSSRGLRDGASLLLRPVDDEEPPVNRHRLRQLALADRCPGASA
ncbi:hypothetical protein FJ492_28510 [Mesorhizobium sp. B2-5-4]|nr:hypothetical protein FJ492_28510 [Mesorhizobium sp. B2-5-4]